MAREVRVFIEDTLQDLSRELSWLRNLRYELCAACTSCLKDGQECVKHGSVRCTDDDCLHLLRVVPEEQLICPKSFSGETIDVCGLEKWFQGHKTEIEEQKVAYLVPEGASATYVGPHAKRAKSTADRTEEVQLDRPRKEALLEDLRKMEIRTVEALKELWEDIKSEQVRAAIVYWDAPSLGSCIEKN
ncbi:hypothetical protein OS493_028754 [Desmophyllum pertusum]|uniref:Uncharacterized protein n=1 Tax=Desmophyllum pertusum TaxID=174260 RepID=A0A9W9Y9H4_9CNID|nr:hypothetical protein OS493_028754 [Desmophyllum pertusum]